MPLTIGITFGGGGNLAFYLITGFERFMRHFSLFSKNWYRIELCVAWVRGKVKTKKKI